MLKEKETTGIIKDKEMSYKFMSIDKLFEDFFKNLKEVMKDEN